MRVLKGSSSASRKDAPSCCMQESRLCHVHRNSQSQSFAMYLLQTITTAVYLLIELESLLVAGVVAQSCSQALLKRGGPGSTEWAPVPNKASCLSTCHICRHARHRTFVRPVLVRIAASAGRSDIAGAASGCGRATLDRLGTLLPGRWRAPARLSARGPSCPMISRDDRKQVHEDASRADAISLSCLSAMRVSCFVMLLCCEEELSELLTLCLMINLLLWQHLVICLLPRPALCEGLQHISTENDFV